MAYEDEMYLENEELELDEDAQEEDSEVEEEEQSPSDNSGNPEKKGNLSVALKQAREESRKYKAELEEKQRLMGKYETLLSNLGQGQRDQVTERDMEEYRSKLALEVLNEPDQFARRIMHETERRVREMNAPIMRENARNYLNSHPEYKDVYEKPSIREAVNAYIDQVVAQQGQVDIQDVEQAMKFFKSIYDEAGSSGKPKISDSGKNKLTSIVSGGKNDSPKRNLSDKDIWEEALKKSPSEYAKWEKDPKNRELVNRILSSSKRN